MANNIILSDSRQVIVSGATGFIGQHLVPLLLDQNYEVIAIARDEGRAEDFEWYPQVRFVATDIYKNTTAIEFKEGASLIHLAWQGLPNYKSLFHFEENLPKSYQFINSLVRRGVNEVLVTGTCFEYGMQNGPLDRDTRAKPSNPYALAKDTLRQCLNYLKQEEPFKLKWARLFYMYGKGQNSKSIIAQLDSAIDAGEKIFHMSGGEQLRDYLSIQSAAGKLMAIFENDSEGIFNVCSGKPISIRRLVEERIKERGSSIKINLGYYPYPDYEPMAFWGVQPEGGCYEQEGIK
jgi:nucleoside-diphosphate-sugar epimerase